ncbi:MAG: DEAD/DEAH box helicase family protein [Thermomicrobiaceae bacterium]
MSGLTEPGALSEALHQTSFRWPFRKYQSLALDAYEHRAPEHQHRCYLVMPPGSGKTALGLEIVRRAGNPAIVFSPNTAVQQQWSDEWQNFQPHTVPATTDPSIVAPLSFLTYQSLCNLNPEHDDLDEAVIELWQQSLQRERGLSPADARREIERRQETDSKQFRRDLSRYRRRARRMIARGDDPDRLLDLLHPNGKQLVDRISALRGCTIVLDECHHLLEMWGYLIRALVDRLGDETLVVGLTATPPGELSEREAELYRDLFGYADFEVPTPAVVREGDLAPYQELGYLTRPLPQEADYIAEQHLRFEELITRILDHQFASRSFLEWVRQRAHDRFSPEGAGISWVRFERDSPDLARAVLRLCYRFEVAPPDGVRLREPHRQPMSADDWVLLIEDFAVRCLRLSQHPGDHQAWEEIRSALPSLGYVLTSRGIRRHVSPIDRVLAHSASKGLAAAAILGVESVELGEQLRALILCDYERTSSDLVAQLRGVLDSQAGSAILLLETLLADPDVYRLNPLLLTGRTVACSVETANRLKNWLSKRAPELASAIEFTPLKHDQDDSGVTITAPGAGWNTRLYVPLITRFYEEGGCQCLIGTRGLLGEGWDARRVNVLVDLTTAATATTVHQMRGRSLRLDPELPEKVANNWDVVCLDLEHPRGMADYDRFVRKHRSYFAPNLEGEIESGVSHVHHSLSPFGPPAEADVAGINAHLLRRAAERARARELWRIGEPYDNQEVATLRVRAGGSFGVPNQRLFRDQTGQSGRSSILTRGGVGALATGATVAGVMATGLDPVAWFAPLVVAGGAVYWTADSFHQTVRSIGPSGNLEDFGLAVMESLRDVGELPGSVRADDLHVVVQEDGYYRCYLSGLTDEESQIFVGALDELLAPLAAPRYIIPRYVAGTPRSVLQSARLGFRYLAEGRTGSTMVFHAVPEPLARNRDRVAAFERAWHRHVSAGEAYFYRSAEAQAILQVQAGEDPFEVTTQMRTLWR